MGKSSIYDSPIIPHFFCFVQNFFGHFHVFRFFSLSEWVFLLKENVLYLPASPQGTFAFVTFFILVPPCGVVASTIYIYVRFSLLLFTIFLPSDPFQAVRFIFLAFSLFYYEFHRSFPVFSIAFFYIV